MSNNGSRLRLFIRENSELDPSITSQIQSYLTETYKQFKLLNLDVSFLRGSQNPQTKQIELANISHRLETLKVYCLSILCQTKLTQNQEKTG
ncbi:MAG: heterocyst frequency control protein PatD [Trichodesmium sp. St2_bin2_1]|nr:heterocyst frequency control protein PatD [Trichodesmium sp. St2_bin2_1]